MIIALTINVNLINLPNFYCENSLLLPAFGLRFSLIGLDFNIVIVKTSKEVTTFVYFLYLKVIIQVVNFINMYPHYFF
jgi:hypothetical protein